MKQILFSPIGNSDPIRDMYDGACLHIIRHYRPEKVVLFFTAEMGALQKKDSRYTKAIRHISPGIEIEEIYTKIVEAHLYDSFFEILPNEVRKLLANADTEVLLNLSSGTPQIKATLAILAVEDPRCHGVQVASPNKASNVKSDPVKPEYNVDEAIENNLDDEETAENRCTEPPLRMFRWYAEKNRLLGLIYQYEYSAAWMLSRNSDTVSDDVKKLLHHVVLRSKLQPAEAKKILAQYDGIKLFRFAGQTEEITEYFYLMQIAQKKGQLSELLVKIIPFLFKLLEQYVSNNTSFPLQQCLNGRKLSRKKLKEVVPELLTELDLKFSEGYRDSDLSFLLLYHICQFIEQKCMANDKETHSVLLAELNKIQNIRQSRNEAAHQIVNISENDFLQQTGLGSAETVDVFARMLKLIYGKEKIEQSRKIYDMVNRWITEGLSHNSL